MANALANKGHKILSLACDNKTGLPFFPLDKKVKFINIGSLTFLEKLILETFTSIECQKAIKVQKRIRLRSFFMKKKKLTQ